MRARVPVASGGDVAVVVCTDARTTMMMMPGVVSDTWIVKQRGRCERATTPYSIFVTFVTFVTLELNNYEMCQDVIHS